MSHLDICSTSYGKKKGRKSNCHRESNCQFNSRPLKVWNWPDSSVCRWSATHCWKILKESYEFASDLIPMSKELWPCKVPRVQTETISGLLLGNPRTKSYLDVGATDKCNEYYMGKVVASPESGPWWILWVLWVQGRPWLVLALKVLKKVN
jgi:hypothetical protein